MGLDMYLTAEKYLSPSEWSGSDSNEQYADVVTVVGAKDFVGGAYPSANVSVSIAYWRKANAIHQWFVDNVQSGEDNCADYYVPREALEELLDTCHEIKTNPDLAEELLPTQQGFFFGETEYGEWYFEIIDDTIGQIEKALKSVPEDWTFHYRSSW